MTLLMSLVFLMPTRKGGMGGKVNKFNLGSYLVAPIKKISSLGLRISNLCKKVALRKISFSRGSRKHDFAVGVNHAVLEVDFYCAPADFASKISLLSPIF